MLEITQDKILFLYKILKKFLESENVSSISKSNLTTKGKNLETTTTQNVYQNEMIVDEDNLEYGKIQNLNTQTQFILTNSGKPNKANFNLYEIKNN